MVSIEELREQVARIEDALSHIRKAITALSAGQGTAEPEQKSKRSKPKHLLPPDWQPSEDVIAWAKESYPNVKVQHEADKFRDYWTASGKTYADWHAAFRNWIRKAAEFSTAKVTRLESRPEGRAATLAQANRDRRDRALDKLASLQQGTTRSQIP